MRLFIIFLFTGLLTGCTAPKAKDGLWRFVINTDGGSLPFHIELTKKPNGNLNAIAINADERLPMDEAYFEGDSLHIPMKIFDAELILHAGETQMTGLYKKRRTNGTYVVGKVTGTWGQSHRFFENSTPTVSIAGKWKVIFRGEKATDTTLALGVFEQNGGQAKGTFLTPTGDYRYLQGNVKGDSLFLSCYDGNHVFLFKAKVKDRHITGEFYANISGKETFSGQLDPTAELPDKTQLTYLKPNAGAFAFTFPDTKGQMVSNTDADYKNKVLVIQIMGSWCPNCMDETRFLVDFKKKNPEVEIIALAFEKSADLKVSAPKLENLKARFGINYPVLLAGTNDKADASAHLPQLNRVASFPTTIFIDKKGQVREIHTGFSGPATGVYYDKFVTEFTDLINQLAKE